MTTVGIDIGGRQHAVARCLEGRPKADREVLRIGHDRAGQLGAQGFQPGDLLAHE